MKWRDFVDAFSSRKLGVKIEDNHRFKLFCEALESEGFFADPDSSIYLRTVRSRSDYPYLAVTSVSKEVACWHSVSRFIAIDELDDFDQPDASLIDEAAKLLEDTGGDAI